jgi:hypothetical protein
MVRLQSAVYCLGLEKTHNCITCAINPRRRCKLSLRLCFYRYVDLREQSHQHLIQSGWPRSIKVRVAIIPRWLHVGRCLLAIHRQDTSLKSLGPPRVDVRLSLGGHQRFLCSRSIHLDDRQALEGQQCCCAWLPCLSSRAKLTQRSLSWRGNARLESAMVVL